jgi:hypothetical protein
VVVNVIAYKVIGYCPGPMSLGTYWIDENPDAYAAANRAAETWGRTNGGSVEVVPWTDEDAAKVHAAIGGRS